MYRIFSTLLLTTLLMPTVTFAEFGTSFTQGYAADQPTPATGASLGGLVKILLGLVYSVEWLLSGLALVIFMLGVTRFVINSAGAKGHAKGYENMLWGLVALFVIFSLNGLLWFMCNNLAGIGKFCSS